MMSKATLPQLRRALRPLAARRARHEVEGENATDIGLMLRLQRQAGNEAVTGLILGLQRKAGGWADADTRGKGWNVEAREVEGTGINRIPVEGIKLGNQQAFYGKAGDSNTDRNKTTESAAGKAIVLVPLALKPSKPIDVMLHLHGYEFRESDPYAGWRQRSSDLTVRDVALDRIEQQMHAAGTTQVIAILAQGIGQSEFGKDPYKLPYDEYVREVLGLVAAMKVPQLPKVPDQYQLVLSAHSGGGLTLAGGKKVREPENLAEIILFDALNRPGHADNVSAWAEEHMKRVREAPRDQWAKELGSCPKLRAYYSDTHMYVTNYGRLKTALLASYERNPPELKAPLEARFPLPVHITGANHEHVVSGLGDDPSAAPLADALAAIDNPEARSKLLQSKAKPASPALKKGAAPQAPVPAESKSKTQGAALRMPAGVIPSERLGNLKTAEETAFRKAVYDEQLRQSLADPKKEFSQGLAEDNIGKVDGNPIRKDVAPDAQRMVNAARVAHQMDKSALALNCTYIGVNNAYRPLEGDFKAWINAYPKALDRTARARKRLSTGPYSKEAVAIMADDLYGKKALPGFSNHTKGLAIDFETTQDGQRLGPTVAQKEDWRKSWLYAWLKKNGAKFGFRQLPTEEWHWDHKDTPQGPSADETVAGQAPTAAAKPAAPVGAPAQATAPKAPSSLTKPAPQVPAQKPAAAPTADGERLSSASWVNKYPTSRSLDDLVAPFKGNVRAFIGMLNANKARVNISATYRPPERAWLMHWAWVIAHDQIKYSRIGRIKDPHKVGIVWDHGDKASTKAAAQAMVDAYAMAHIAALSSRHTEGRAVDMTITGLPRVLTIADGETVEIGRQKATANEALHRLAEDNYSVVKLKTDPPHWSADGH